jgi:16S rRNA pseudouridine516 synthase
LGLERLDKILSNQGFGSRKQIHCQIRNGDVKINGRVINNPELKLDPETASIEIKGKSISISRFIYIMLNKPAGVLTATRDKKAETVLNLVPQKLKRPGLFPTGRLDKDTEGLLIITDDGNFAHQMLSPKKHIPKTYLAKLQSPIDNTARQKFTEGIVIDDGYKCMPAQLIILEPYLAELTICEGKFHQVKRMFQAIGNEVISLKRTRFGNLFLDNQLKAGECRLISQEDIDNIR